MENISNRRRRRLSSNMRRYYSNNTTINNKTELNYAIPRIIEKLVSVITVDRKNGSGGIIQNEFWKNFQNCKENSEDTDHLIQSVNEVFKDKSEEAKSALEKIIQFFYEYIMRKTSDGVKEFLKEILAHNGMIDRENIVGVFIKKMNISFTEEKKNWERDFDDFETIFPKFQKEIRSFENIYHSLDMIFECLKGENDFLELKRRFDEYQRKSLNRGFQGRRKLSGRSMDLGARMGELEKLNESLSQENDELKETLEFKEMTLEKIKTGINEMNLYLKCEFDQNEDYGFDEIFDICIKRIEDILIEKDSTCFSMSSIHSDDDVVNSEISIEKIKLMFHKFKKKIKKKTEKLLTKTKEN